MVSRAEEEGVLGVEDRGVAAGGVAAGLPVPLLGVQAEELMGAGMSEPGTPGCCWACCCCCCRVCPHT